MTDFEKEGKKVDDKVNKAETDANKTAKSASKKAKNTVDSAAKETEKVIDKATGEDKTAYERVEAKVEKAAETIKETTEKAADELSKDAKKFAELASENFEKASDKIVDELRDPAVSTTVLFTVVTASAASTYLSQQHKQGTLSGLLATGVVLGVAALSVAEYFSVKAYFRRNGQ